MLISHYNALLGESKTLTGMVGTIDQQCDITAICRDAYEAAAVLCAMFLCSMSCLVVSWRWGAYLALV